jgi:hypothetical protein
MEMFNNEHKKSMMRDLSTEEKLILLVLYAAELEGKKLDWEKVKAAVIFLLKAKEEGLIKLEKD